MYYIPTTNNNFKQNFHLFNKLFNIDEVLKHTQNYVNIIIKAFRGYFHFSQRIVNDTKSLYRKLGILFS